MKRFMLLALLVAAMAFMAACGETPAGGGGGTAEAPVVIQVATSGSHQEMQLRYDTGALFMEENEDVVIEWIDIGGDRIQVTMTLIAGGEAPDILYINEQVIAFATLGSLLPLNDLIDNDPNFDHTTFYQGLMDANTWQGNIYAFPQEVSPFVMYFNIDMFEERGVPLPHDNWTRDEFYAAALALTNPDEMIFGYQHFSGWADQHLGWFLRAGVTNSFRNNYTEIAFDGPETLDALRFIHRMTAIDKVSPDPAEAQAMGLGFGPMFRNQMVAMTSAGLWMLPQYLAEPLDFNWDVVRMPMDRNQYTKAGVLNWAIYNNSSNVDEAWRFLTYLVGPVGMRIVAESHMALPANTDEEANRIIRESGFPPNIQAFIDSAPLVNLNTTMSPHRLELMNELNAQMDLLMLDQQTPEETQEAIVQRLNAILAHAVN